MLTPTPTEILALAPQIVLAVTAGVLLLLEAFVPRFRLALSETTLVAIGAAMALRLSGPLPGPCWAGAIRVDGVTSFVDVFILTAAFLAAWVAGPFLQRVDAQRGEFYALLLLSSAGAMLMASADDLLIVLIGLELLSMPLYVLNAFLRSTAVSLESGLKYFVVGSFASAFAVYGIALLYGATGSTSISAVGRAVADLGALEPLAAIGLAALLAGLAFKLAVVPFHAWAPDVYQGGPSPVVAFLSVAPKAAVLVVVVRVVNDLDLATSSSAWLTTGATAAVASQTLGNVVAIVQRDIKRMLAYSGIAHMGYALIGVVSGGLDGASAVLTYLGAYTVMNAGAFVVICVLSEDEGQSHFVSELAGQGWRRPLLGLALTVFMVSLAGIPPTVGFTAKFMIFRSAVNSGLVWLAVVGVLNSLIAAFYYLRVVFTLYMKPEPTRAPSFPTSFTITAAAVIVAVVSILMGLYPTSFLAAAQVAASNLVR